VPKKALTYDYISYKSAEIMPMFVIVATVVLCATSVYNCCKMRDYTSLSDTVKSVGNDTQTILRRLPKIKYDFDDKIV
jgi:hypothetical protein